MATITTICESVGANRIVPTIAIPYPVGNPKVSKNEEQCIRENLVAKAIEALGTKIAKQAIF